MGIVRTHVTFKERAPALPSLAEKISEISGLPVSIIDSVTRFRDGFSETSAFISFQCAPKDRIKIKVLNGFPTVTLSDISSLEPTLWYTTILALEALGGGHRPPLKEEIRQKYAMRISESQFLRRRRFARVKLLLASPVYILLVPVTLSIWVGWWLLNLPSDAVGNKWWSRTRNGRRGKNRE